MEDAFETKHFASPAEAIPEITELIAASDFSTLAAYYDLSDSDVKVSELESGSFFIRTERPEMAHPAGFWRYKHPFAPGFTFSCIRPSSQAGVFVVEVSRTIAQGDCFPEQVCLSYFYMIQSDSGWKILPDVVTEIDLKFAPSQRMAYNIYIGGL